MLERRPGQASLCEGTRSYVTNYYITYYNAERHSALGYLVPNYFETQFQTAA
jgi:hypothetical protein